MKLKMLKGLPGSGKTTLAKEMLASDGNSGRVNRDTLREMVFDGKWSGPKEGIIIDIEKAIAEVLLKNKKNVIVDDTNLSESHLFAWKNFAEDHQAEFVLEDLKVDIETCIERDRLRSKRVGKAIIHRMALQSGMIDWGEKKIILVDIDGTLCNGLHRQHFVTGEVKDWKSYFNHLGGDTPIEIVCKWVKELSKEYTICLVSGRPDTYQNQTMGWLDVYNIPYDWLFMRRGSDSRSDVIVKNEILKYLPKEKIEFVLDDRPVVIREVWRANNIKVYPVAGECEEF